MILNEIIQGLIHFLFPPVCFSCHRDIPQDHKDVLCKSCSLRLMYIKPLYCSICGIKIDGGSLCYRCSRRERRFNFEFSRSVFLYNNEISSLIIAYKYNKVKWLYKWFSDKMLKALDNYPEFKEYNCICYVPLSGRKLRERGFNQSELIAREISTALSIELLSDTVIRVKDIKSQVGLGFEERIENVKGCFEVRDKEKVKGKSIIIIDDVATTMSTLNEISYVFKKAGAKKISCFTIAREG